MNIMKYSFEIEWNENDMKYNGGSLYKCMCSVDFVLLSSFSHIFNICEISMGFLQTF